MLTISKVYLIVDDKNDTLITIERDDGGIYHWNVKNADGDELGFTLTDLNMSNVLKAIKDIGNFV